MKKKVARCYFITGKGGVGKTTLALALTHALNKEGVSASYWGSGLVEDADLFSFPLKVPKVEESVYLYAEQKFGPIIGRWIVGTSFFQSFIKMLPSVPYVLFLGQLVEFLEKTEDEVVVFDSPSSGHALTMLEAVSQFREIFGQGILFDDLLRVQRFLEHPELFKTLIVTIPTELALKEGEEFQELIAKSISIKPDIVVNSVLSEGEKIEDNKLTSFLRKKIENERLLLKKKSYHRVFPYITTCSYKSLVLELSPLMTSII